MNANTLERHVPSRRFPPVSDAVSAAERLRYACEYLDLYPEEDPYVEEWAKKIRRVILDKASDPRFADFYPSFVYALGGTVDDTLPTDDAKIQALFAEIDHLEST